MQKIKCPDEMKEVNVTDFYFILNIFRAKSQEPRTKSKEPRTKTKEARTKNQEPRQKNQELRAKN
jgi:hypothetical protein